VLAHPHQHDHAQQSNETAPQTEKLDQPRASRSLCLWARHIVGRYLSPRRRCGKDWQLAEIRVCNWNKTLRPSTTEDTKSVSRTLWTGAGVLLLLTLFMFGDVLFTSHLTMLSSSTTDIASIYAYWRPFAAEQLRQGHVPLWNPYVFCGQPFLGWGVGGVLYPPNWLDLILSLPRSINFGITLHIFLAGLFTYLWSLRRGLHPLAAITSAALFMFSGAYFFHVYAGHLMLLYGLAWMPLVLLSVDEWIRTRKFGWLLLGMVAVAMQLFVGDLQGWFYTAVIAGLLTVFQLFKAQQRPKIFLGFFAMYVGATALGSVQLLTSLQAGSESVRGGGVTYEFASMVSFAPENLLTLLAPGFFGNMSTVPYWGRWYLWEMCLFMGISGLTLVVYGAACGRRELRRALVPLTIITLILALGSNTPLFHILYRWVPGFDRLRGSAKFGVHASLFMAMLAGIGLDHLLKSPRENKWWALGLLITGFIIGSVALEIRSSAHSSEPTTWWTRAMQSVYATQETYPPPTTYTDPASIKKSAAFASHCLFIAAAEFLVVSGLFFLAGTSRKMVYALAFMSIVEVFLFARTTRATFEFSDTQSPNLRAFLDKHPGDDRIFYQRTPNMAMWLGKEDVWGYSPSTLKRYAEFMAFTQGQPPDGVTLYVEMSQFHPLHAMLRWRYAFIETKEGDRILTAKSVMPHLQLIQEYQVVHGRDAIFQAMTSPTFDPQQQVILETEPSPAPTSFPERGTATVVNSSPGQLTVEADLPRPAILLITDAYSNGWRAQPLEGSAQRAYEVLPANYTLQAVPLSAGHHHFQLEYLPAAYQKGKWISIVSIIGFLLGTGYFARKSYHLA
jgi:hypothetical protein